MQSLRPATLLKRDSNTDIFLWNFQKIFRVPSFTLPVAASSIFYNVQISIGKNTFTRWRHLINCTYRRKGCILIVVRTHIDYIFPIGNENLSSSQNCSHVISPAEFWFSIHIDKNRPVLDNYETEIIRSSFYSSYQYLLQGSNAANASNH